MPKKIDSFHITEADSSLDSTLGNDRRHCVPILPPDDDQNRESITEYRYRLQGLARELLVHHDPRLKNCLRTTAPFSGPIVEVRRNPDTGSAHYRNLELCNHPWTCPVCAARISNHRRQELSAALAAAKLLNWQPVMVTYTLQHNYRDHLEPLLRGLLEALRLFKSGRAYQEIKAEYGLQGGIRVLEPTYGENGWHPHVHELLFLDLGDTKLTPAMAAGLRKWIVDRWVGCLRKFNLDASYAHGVDVRTADSAIADYIAKHGREPREKTAGVEHEITGAANKRARHDALTPFQLLEAYEYGSKRAGRLFVEYAETMSGRHQIAWSKGLRAALALPEELIDSEIPGFEEESTTFTAVEIDQANFSKLAMYELRGTLLVLVAAGEFLLLEQLFTRYGIKATIRTSAPEVAPPAAPAPRAPPVPVPVQVELIKSDKTYGRG